MGVEVCGNCERKIGKLETPCVWQGEMVCQQCHDLLEVAEKPSTANAKRTTEAEAIRQRHGGTLTAAEIKAEQLERLGGRPSNSTPAPAPYGGYGGGLFGTPLKAITGTLAGLALLGAVLLVIVGKMTDSGEAVYGPLTACAFFAAVFGLFFGLLQVKRLF
jgi:hypothetical protein